MPTSDSSFYHLGIAPKTLKLLEKLKFKHPTPIQHKAIPIIIEGKDILGVAQTGTGKTLAFGIPTIQRLAASDRGQALIVVPTRELAAQVEQALRPLLLDFSLESAVLIGGIPVNRQLKQIAKKPRVIIATPGRLIDLLHQGKIHLKDATILILDEADRMFDMGFQPQIEEILKKMTKKRQTLLFSATMPEGIVKLATKHMVLPVPIEIAPSGTTTEQTTQEIFIVKEDKKKSLLKAVLKEYRGPILMFVRTKSRAQRAKKHISGMGFQVAEIHSNRSMAQRKAALDGFKKGRYQILVATDIAARGIDVSNIELVLNFDLPDDVDSYVHRIGRTGRAGAEGHAISFAKPDQGLFVTKIEKLMRKSLPISQHEELSENAFDAISASMPENNGHRSGSFETFRRRKSSQRPGKSGYSSRPNRKKSGQANGHHNNKATKQRIKTESTISRAEGESEALKSERDSAKTAQKSRFAKSGKKKKHRRKALSKQIYLRSS